MFYPIITIYKENNIEITASAPDKNGDILVYVEQWSPAINNFLNLKVKLPQKEILFNNFPKEISDKLYSQIISMSEDIFEYISDQEKTEEL